MGIFIRTCHNTGFCDMRFSDFLDDGANLDMVKIVKGMRQGHYLTAYYYTVN